MPKTKDKGVLVRMTETMRKELTTAVATANKLGGYDEQSVGSVIRQLCVEYINKVKVLAESEAAAHAAAVLRGARRVGKAAGR